MRPAITAWVTSVLGPVEESVDLSRNGGRVVAVTDRRGNDWVVKTVPTGRAFDNELNAYLHWVPRFADQAPGLHDAHPRLRTLVMQHLPGIPEWSFEPQHHRDAGRLLARIHGCAPPRSDGPTVAEATACLLDRAVTRLPSGVAVSDRELCFVTASLEMLGTLAHLPRVPCHGDYSGHNWLRGDGPLRVIDFSGAGWSPAALDFARLFVGPWWERPDLAEAFFDGYGRPLSDAELEAVRHQLPIFAFSVLAHGHRRGNPEMVRRGQRRLHRLMAGHDFTRRAPLARRLAQAGRGLVSRPRALASRPS